MPRAVATDINVCIVALARDGLPPAAIERALGGAVSRQFIYWILSRARAEGVSIPHFPTRDARSLAPAVSPYGACRISVPYETLTRLQPAAITRRISVSELVRRLLCVIARDGLADSVLDDAAGGNNGSAA